MENFRKPNFELVADILYWMVKLYVPPFPIPITYISYLWLSNIAGMILTARSRTEWSLRAKGLSS
ncbi:hypothetical protein EON65_16610 [archaeon]|nr:MAG: hypothetical protein EON65_16610 [archaeon]